MTKLESVLKKRLARIVREDSHIHVQDPGKGYTTNERIQRHIGNTIIKYEQRQQNISYRCQYDYPIQFEVLKLGI